MVRQAVFVKSVENSNCRPSLQCSDWLPLKDKLQENELMLVH